MSTSLPPIPITIIGAGITSLSTAYHLTHSPSHAERYTITIIARDLPGDLNTNWASPWAGAIFQPQPTTSKLNQQLQTTSFKHYYTLAFAHPFSTTGIKIYPTTEYYDSQSATSSTPSPSNTWIHTLMPDFRTLSDSSLPSETGITSGICYTSLAINPSLFLPWLKVQLDIKNVTFIRREVASIEEARTLTGDPKIIINATGAGARELVGDEDVMGIRGQTMFVKSDFKCLIMREGSEYTYVIPRPGSGGVILGGVKEYASTPNANFSQSPDGEMRRDILRRCNLMTGGAFENVNLDAEGEVKDIVGFRPGREEGMRVERVGSVVHAYGMAGAGYIYSFGVAERVGVLVEEACKE